MPSALSYPGVYIEEIPSGVRAITGVATSITGFVGYAKRGPVNKPTVVQSYLDFARTFGGLQTTSTMSYAVQQYFLNGGRDALIVRAAHLTGAGTNAKKARVSVGGAGAKQLILEAASEGSWADDLRVRIDQDTKPEVPGPASLFNLSIKDVGTGIVEVLRNLPPGASLAALVEQQSSLVRVATAPTARPDAHSAINPGDDPFDPAVATRFTAFPSTGADSGEDGDLVEADVVPATDDGTGVYALARADLFNLLVIPPILPASDAGAGRVLSAAAKSRAAAFCQTHRALFIVDPHPDWTGPSQITSGIIQLSAYITIGSDDRKNAAIYFPYLRSPDPLQGDAPADFPPAGAVAGVMARTDARRGVWKAPAGLDAGVAGVQELKAKLTDGENGIVNPFGVNVLRTFPAAGTVVWGSRTLAGADALASEWKYVPVRRTALFLEESLYRGTQWVVFEPNDAPLWAQIRLNIGAFMNILFRQGAFAGTTPREAFFVKCDGETTTPDDVNLGIVNIVVGFAPLKPAEFVVIKLQQIAGQTGSA
jgi:phage tail sheath protein FI